MTSTGYTELRGVSDFGSFELNNQIEHGLIAFFKWGLLGIGAFSNINDSSRDHNGNNLSQLKLVKERNFTDGQVWEGRRGDWVWESGVNYGTQPIDPSGVTVNGTFRSIDDVGAYSHYIDYEMGRIVFNSAINTSSTVKVNHSYRNVRVGTADSEWYKRIIGFQASEEGWLATGSGDRDWNMRSRVELPAIAIICDGRRNFTNLELGGGQVVHQGVSFTVFAENSWERNNLMDIVANQNHLVFYLYDQNLLLENGQFPLDSRGMKVNNVRYPDLVADGSEYRYKKCRIEDMAIVDSGIYNDSIFFGLATATVYVEMPQMV